MPPVARVGDSVVHGCFGTHQVQAGSGNVFANGIPVARLGDPVNVHCCGPVCHSGTFAAGAGKVFVNGKPCIRIGDPCECGSTAAAGSGNVFSN
jgi:uncharacterized Zn-binding protein involved in type VI secretion